jgi:hypothetical protein
MDELTNCSPQPKIPVNIERSKFLSCEEFTADGVYKILATNITSKEFNLFIVENLGFPVKFTYFQKNILVPLYQYGNESSIHEAAVSKLIGIIESFNDTHRLTLGSAQTRQEMQNFSRQPDFGIRSKTRYKSSISNSNIVGEIMYSQNLTDGHQIAQQYLASDSDILGFVLIDLEYPWPGRNNDVERDLVPGKMVYYFYERPEIEQNNIIPRTIVSFGTSPLNELDIQLICGITGCRNETIVGFRYDNLIPCDDHNEYIQFIPGNCLLRHNCHDAQVLVGEVVFPLNSVPQNFDMVINLYRIQYAVCMGATLLPING